MDFTPVYGTLNEIQLLRAQNQKGDNDIYRLLSRQRYTGVFYASLRYIERNSAIEGTTKLRGGTDITFPVTAFLAQNTMSLCV